MKNRKGLALAIMEKLPPPGKRRDREEGSEEGDEEEGDDGMGKEAAARALIRAIESNNPGDVVDAFEDLYGMCS